MSFAAFRDAVLRGALHQVPVADDRRIWTEAVQAAARGDLARAEELARVLTTAGAEPDVEAAACLTLASVLRQLGRHSEAGALDDRALVLARDDAMRADALIGLAADAVGAADAQACERRLSEAARAAPVDDPRVAVRLEWVRTEHALLTLDARAAVGHARVAVHMSRSVSDRHLAKSLLFLGASLDAAGSSEAMRYLDEALERAEQTGAAAIGAAARDILDRRSRVT